MSGNNPGEDMKNPFRKTLVPVLDLVLPRVCIVCGRRLLTFEKHICTCCLADLPLTFNWILPHNPMADRFNELIQESLCRTLQDGATPSGHVAYSHAAALFFFNSEADYRKIPYSIKYRGDLASGLFFGAMLGKRMAEASALQDIDLIMPVPLYWSRKWKRGYNQAEVIARAASQAGIKNIVMYNVSKTHHSYILRDIFRYRALIVGAPTYNAGLYHEMEVLLSEIAGKDIKNRHYIGWFGSYAWAGKAVAKIKEWNDGRLHFEPVGNPVEIRQSLTAETHAACEALSQSHAESGGGKRISLSYSGQVYARILCVGR